MIPLTRIYSEMRRQPVIGLVTLFGTALAIFLIMIVVLMQNVNTIPFSPESNRGRFLHGRHLHMKTDNGECSGGMSYQTARPFFCALEGAEAVSLHTDGSSQTTAGIPDAPQAEASKLETDADFWKVFDFTFIHGNPYSAADVESEAKVAVISESLAREVFGTPDAVGRTIMLDHFVPYTVRGVVKDVSPLATTAYATVWTPLSHDARNNTWYNYFGGITATVLAKDRSDFDRIRKCVTRNKAKFNTAVKAENEAWNMIDHGSPFPQEMLQYATWSNQPPDVGASESRRTRLAVYAILLLIPAINLSSMAQSRLRRRVSEMGVRRAFGCTRLRMVRDIVTENLIVTLAGGLIGLLLSLLAVWLFADMLFTGSLAKRGTVAVAPEMLLQWSTFGWALLFCFLLNLLSSGLPAWRAARMNPTDAIGGLQK